MITANEVASAVGGLNKRARQPIPEALKRNPPLYIFNIYEMKHTRGLGSLGTFHVPACEPGETYSKPLVVKGEFFDEFDRGEGALGWTYETGADVAKAILNVGHRDGADLSAWGVFLSERETPTRAELASAREKLTSKMREVLAAGDALALQGDSGLAQIQAIHRKAAHYLKQHRDWINAEPVEMRDCHGCGAFVKPTLPRCPQCKAPFDLTKCRELWPLEYPVVSLQLTAPDAARAR